MTSLASHSPESHGGVSHGAVESAHRVTHIVEVRGDFSEVVRLASALRIRPVAVECFRAHPHNDVWIIEFTARGAKAQLNTLRHFIDKLVTVVSAAQKLDGDREQR